MLCGVSAYMVAVVMTVYDGLLSVLFQPVVGLILTAIACASLLVVASPLLIPAAWKVWRRAWPLPLLIAIGGVVAMLLSWHPALRVQVWDPDNQIWFESFQPALAIGGWVGMLFGILWMPKLAISQDGRWA